MDFKQKKRLSSNENKYHLENLAIAREFSKGLILEMNEFVKSIVLFGSNTHDTLKKDSDIDIMVVLDNVSVFVSEELREAYRIITSKLNKEVGHDKIHLMTMNLTDLWDMARKGDPVLINVLRYGLPLFDRDLVEPMQYLLEIGRIKPTRESAYNYMGRADTLINDVDRYLYDAALDIYYAVVDIVHASLIVHNVEPPSPKQMPAIFKKTFKKNAVLLKYAEFIDETYKLAKDIEKRSVDSLTWNDVEKRKKKAIKFIELLKTHIEEEIKKKDIFEF